MARKTKKANRSSSSNKNSISKSQPEAMLPGNGQQILSDLEERLDSLGTTNRHLKRKIFDLYTVFEISRNFSSVLDYRVLLDGFIFTCLGQMSALKGTIFLKTEAKPDSFCPVKSKGSGELPSLEDCISGNSRLIRYLTKMNRPSLVDDLLRDFRENEETQILKFFEGGVFVPLLFRNKLIGLFAVAEKLSGRQFGADDLEFLSILGNQIAVAIENARLYESERRATSQLRAAQQQLLHSERLAALGDMSAKVAHEVNNPLGIIKNYLSLLQRDSVDADSHDEYVGIVRGEINRIAEIVRQLLDFHRPQQTSMEAVDIQELLDNIYRLISGQFISREIIVNRGFQKNNPLVKGNPEQLKQVFLNLLINARDAMKKGGELTMTVSKNAENALIDIDDTGDGIATEHIEHIFEPFYTTKEPGEGTGLGLSVCYGIIKNHQGSILFRNTKNGGRFTITLPLWENREE